MPEELEFVFEELELFEFSEELDLEDFSEELDCAFFSEEFDLTLPELDDSSTLLELSAFSLELSPLPETESSEHATNKAVNALNKNILFIILPFLIEKFIPRLV